MAYVIKFHDMYLRKYDGVQAWWKRQQKNAKRYESRADAYIEAKDWSLPYRVVKLVKRR